MEQKAVNFKDILKQMHKNLECAICLELLTNPVSTNCDHHFCSFCITKFFHNKRSVPCPLCKVSVTKRSLQERTDLSSIVNSVKKLITALEGELDQGGRDQNSLTVCRADQVKNEDTKSKSVKETTNSSAQSAQRRSGRKCRKEDASPSDQPTISYTPDILNNLKETSAIEGRDNPRKLHKIRHVKHPDAYKVDASSPERLCHKESGSRGRDASNGGGDDHEKELLLYLEEGSCGDVWKNDEPGSGRGFRNRNKGTEASPYSTDMRKNQLEGREEPQDKENSKTSQQVSEIVTKRQTSDLEKNKKPSPMARLPLSPKKRSANKPDGSFEQSAVVEDKSIFNLSGHDLLEPNEHPSERISQKSAESVDGASPVLSNSSFSSTQQLQKPIQAVSRVYTRDMMRSFKADKFVGNWADSLSVKDRGENEQNLDVEKPASRVYLTGLTTKDKINAKKLRASRALDEKGDKEDNLIGEFQFETPATLKPTKRSIFKTKQNYGKNAETLTSNSITGNDVVDDPYEFKGGHTPEKEKNLKRKMNNSNKNKAGKKKQKNTAAKVPLQLTVEKKMPFPEEMTHLYDKDENIGEQCTSPLIGQGKDVKEDTHLKRNSVTRNQKRVHFLEDDSCLIEKDNEEKSGKMNKQCDHSAGEKMLSNKKEISPTASEKLKPFEHLHEEKEKAEPRKEPLMTGNQTGNNETESVDFLAPVCADLQNTAFPVRKKSRKARKKNKSETSDQHQLSQRSVTELEKLKNKIMSAEDYEFISNTQEARQCIQQEKQKRDQMLDASDAFGFDFIELENTVTVDTELGPNHRVNAKITKNTVTSERHLETELKHTKHRGRGAVTASAEEKKDVEKVGKKVDDMPFKECDDQISGSHNASQQSSTICTGSDKKEGDNAESRICTVAKDKASSKYLTENCENSSTKVNSASMSTSCNIQRMIVPDLSCKNSVDGNEVTTIGLTGSENDTSPISSTYTVEKGTAFNAMPVVNAENVTHAAKKNKSPLNSPETKTKKEDQNCTNSKPWLHKFPVTPSTKRQSFARPNFKEMIQVSPGPVGLTLASPRVCHGVDVICETPVFQALSGSERSPVPSCNVDELNNGSMDHQDSEVMVAVRSGTKDYVSPHQNRDMSMNMDRKQKKTKNCKLSNSLSQRSSLGSAVIPASAKAGDWNEKQGPALSDGTLELQTCASFDPKEKEQEEVYALDTCEEFFPEEKCLGDVQCIPDTELTDEKYDTANMQQSNIGHSNNAGHELNDDVGAIYISDSIKNQEKASEELCTQDSEQDNASDVTDDLELSQENIEYEEPPPGIRQVVPKLTAPSTNASPNASLDLPRALPVDNRFTDNATPDSMRDLQPDLPAAKRVGNNFESSPSTGTSNKANACPSQNNTARSIHHGIPDIADATVAETQRTSMASTIDMATQNTLTTNFEITLSKKTRDMAESSLVQNSCIVIDSESSQVNGVNKYCEVEGNQNYISTSQATESSSVSESMLKIHHGKKSEKNSSKSHSISVDRAKNLGACAEKKQVSECSTEMNLDSYDFAMRRKTRSSSLKRKSAGDAPLSSSVVSRVKVKGHNPFINSAPERRVDSDSEAEDSVLIIRRPKRKCYSLESLPVKPVVFYETGQSNKSCSESLHSEKTAGVISESSEQAREENSVKKPAINGEDLAGEHCHVSGKEASQKGVVTDEPEVKKEIEEGFCPDRPQSPAGNDCFPLVDVTPVGKLKGIDSAGRYIIDTSDMDVEDVDEFFSPQKQAISVKPNQRLANSTGKGQDCIDLKANVGLNSSNSKQESIVKDAEAKNRSYKNDTEIEFKKLEISEKASASSTSSSSASTGLKRTRRGLASKLSSPAANTPTSVTRRQPAIDFATAAHKMVTSDWRKSKQNNSELTKNKYAKEATLDTTGDYSEVDKQESITQMEIEEAAKSEPVQEAAVAMDSISHRKKSNKKLSAHQQRAQQEEDDVEKVRLRRELFGSEDSELGAKSNEDSESDDEKLSFNLGYDFAEDDADEDTLQVLRKLKQKSEKKMSAKNEAGSVKPEQNLNEVTNTKETLNDDRDNLQDKSEGNNSTPDSYWKTSSNSAPKENAHCPEEVIACDDEVDEALASQYSQPLTSSPLVPKDSAMDSQLFDESAIVTIDASDSEEDDDDQDEDINHVGKKAPRRQRILSDSEEESSHGDDQQNNFTSSSALSSQSEILTTQQREALEGDVDKLHREISRFEAELQKEKNQCQENAEPRVYLKDGEADDGKGKATVKPRGKSTDNENKQEKNLTTGADGTEDEDSNDLFFSPFPPSPLPKYSTVTKSLPKRPVLSNTKQTEEMFKQFQSPSGTVRLKKSLDFIIMESKQNHVLSKSDVISDKSQADAIPDQHLKEDQEKSDKSLTQKQFEKVTALQNKTTDGDEALTETSIVEKGSESNRKISTRSPDELCNMEDIEVILESENESTPASPVLSSQARRKKEVKAESSKEREGTAGLHLKDAPTRNLSLVASGLNREETLMVKRFVEVYGAKFSTKFHSGVTHVIMKPASGYTRVCDRTLKFFQGIAHKCWVVSFPWIVECLCSEQLVPESKFEIEGDTSGGETANGSRQSRTSRKPLFSDFSIACVGNCNEMPKETLTELLVCCGARVVEDAIELVAAPSKFKLIVRCSDAESSPSAVECDMFKGFYKHMSLLTVMREWVLDCISYYKIIPLAEFVLNTGDSIKVPF